MVQSAVVFAFLVCAVASVTAVENPVIAYVTSTSKSASVEVFIFPVRCFILCSLC